MSTYSLLLYNLLNTSRMIVDSKFCYLTLTYSLIHSFFFSQMFPIQCYIVDILTPWLRAKEDLTTQVFSAQFMMKGGQFSVLYSTALIKCKFFQHLIWFSSVQSLSQVLLFVTPCTAAGQASLSITNSQSLLKLMFIKSVMPFNHLIFCHPLLLLPSSFPSIGVLSNESVLCIRSPKY